MKQLLKTISPYLIISVLSILLFRECTKPIKKVKTTIDIERVIDSLKENIRIPTPIKDTIFIDKIVYVKTEPIILKGKDTIIYRADTTKLPIEVNRYDKIFLKADSAFANLSIYTTGELFDVKGTIHYNKQTKTIENTLALYNDATYLYFETSIMPFLKKATIGIDRTLGKRLIIGTSIEFIPYQNQSFLNFKIGYNLSNSSSF